MEIFIDNIKDYSKAKRTIIIRDQKISLIDGDSCYEKLLTKDIDFISNIEKKISSITFGWKEEYVGKRLVDGEKYHICIDVNHKKKKYKIQNKFPDNWEEFLQIEKLIIEEQEQ